MNKQELLNSLTSKSWIGEGGIVGVSLEETKPNGDKWYMVNVREIGLTTAIYRNIHFYVMNEGTENEAAYFKDNDPVPTLDMSTSGILRREIASDPLSIGYSGKTKEEQLELLNSKSQESNEPEKFITLRTLMSVFGLSPAVTLYEKLKSASGNPHLSSLKYVLDMLTDCSQGGGVDILDKSTQEALGSLVTAGVFTESEKQLFLSLTKTSRAKILIGRDAKIEDLN